MVSFSFPKQLRILNRSDFVNANRSGKRLLTNHFVVTLRQNGLGIARLGVTVRKSIGNAVKRNRVKRLLREVFRLNQSRFPQGYDIVIAAKKDADCMDLRNIEKELGEILFDQKLRL